MMKKNVMQKHTLGTLLQMYYVKSSGERVQRQELWPPRSSNLYPCDFYLCGLLKGNAYINNTHSLEKLQENIRRESCGIPAQQLRLCLAEGRHFKTVL
jgi:hypothetical protein